MTAMTLVTAVASAAVAHAEPSADEQLTQLRFLEARIETQRTHAELWWKGWLAFYAFGMVVQGTRAAVATEPVDQADLWVSFAKATGGVVRYVVDPYQGIQGIEPSPRQARYLDVSTRLARAERILEHNARRTNAFGPWYAHLINFGINGLGGVIVGAGYDGWEQGMISAAIGFGVGELTLFTAPWEADSDLVDYRQQGSPALVLRPMGTGVALQLAY